MDGHTDRWTIDGWTDGGTNPHIEIWDTSKKWQLFAPNQPFKNQKNVFYFLQSGTSAINTSNQRMN